MPKGIPGSGKSKARTATARAKTTTTKRSAARNTMRRTTATRKK